MTEEKNFGKGVETMTHAFRPDCLPVLIGSLPLDDHGEAVRLVMAYTPEIPLWVQLPSNRMEGMLAQFLPGMPGLTDAGDRFYIDTGIASFDEELLRFYEEYMAVEDGSADLEETRFVLGRDTAKGFFAFTDAVSVQSPPPMAVKGQITGPITLTTGVSDQDRKAIFYDDRLRDTAVKLLALKARWQVRQLSQFGCPVILFLDEPAMAGFGTSDFTSISREAVLAALEEVTAAVHAEGGLAGIHVCANTDWSLVLESNIEIVNFDAYGYFDKFVLYADPLKRFLAADGIIAWGLVPTTAAETIDRETPESLLAQWEEKLDRLQAIGIDRDRILARSLITPSCGTGSISSHHAKKVLELTRKTSDLIRSKL
jgi:methionine synthase II (cobalamin-independent)